MQNMVLECKIAIPYLSSFSILKTLFGYKKGSKYFIPSQRNYIKPLVKIVKK